MFDYKRILKSEKTRYRILHAINFLPDNIMIPIQYQIKTGRKLNLENPQRYTEKLQWYKLFYRDPLMKECVDKWDVRRYVNECGLGDILNDSFGVFNNPEEIDWDLLPDKFVIKDTLGSGGRSMIIVEDKSELNIADANAKMKSWITTSLNKKNFGREWVYDGKPHRIIIEKLLVGNSEGDLPDYKLFCFNGRVFCSYMMENYTRHHELGRLGFLNREFELLSVRRKDFTPMDIQPQKPENYSKMISIAERLSQGFPHVRVDLYNINGNIIFGEMTFFNGSGYIEFDPDSFYFEMGEQFSLPLKMTKQKSKR